MLSFEDVLKEFDIFLQTAWRKEAYERYLRYHR